MITSIHQVDVKWKDAREEGCLKPLAKGTLLEAPRPVLWQFQILVPGLGPTLVPLVLGALWGSSRSGEVGVPSFPDRDAAAFSQSFLAFHPHPGWLEEGTPHPTRSPRGASTTHCQSLGAGTPGAVAPARNLSLVTKALPPALIPANLR